LEDVEVGAIQNLIGPEPFVDVCKLNERLVHFRSHNSWLFFPGEVCNVRVSYHISPTNLNHKNSHRNPQSGSHVFWSPVDRGI
jgi:hypothetical protein